MSNDITERDPTKSIQVSEADVATTQHVPDAVSPIESPTLDVNPALIDALQSAAKWAARVPPEPPDAPVRPEVQVSVSGTIDATLYTPDGTAPGPTWKGLLVAPKDKQTLFPGDAAPFRPGVRGKRNRLSLETIAARTAAVTALQSAQPGAEDFSALLSPSSAAVNVWRVGPGGITLDVAIGQGAPPAFNGTLTCRVACTDATLREAYVPAGGFFRPVGATLDLRRVSDTEIIATIDLRRADPRATFVRIVIPWELSLEGEKRQCLVAMRPPSPLPAPSPGAVLFGGSVIGNTPYPVSAGLSYGFTSASAEGTVGAVSPEGLPVFAAGVDGTSALFGEGANLDIGVLNTQLTNTTSYFVTATIAAVGNWKGEMSDRSTVYLEYAVDGSDHWVTAGSWTISNDSQYPQSYPQQAGQGENAAGTGASAFNKYQFGSFTPAAVQDTEVTSGTSTVAAAKVDIPSVYLGPDAAGLTSKWSSVDSAGFWEGGNLPTPGNQIEEVFFNSGMYDIIRQVSTNDLTELPDPRIRGILGEMGASGPSYLERYFRQQHSKGKFIRLTAYERRRAMRDYNLRREDVYFSKPAYLRKHDPSDRGAPAQKSSNFTKEMESTEWKVVHIDRQITRTSSGGRVFREDPHHGGMVHWIVTLQPANAVIAAPPPSTPDAPPPPPPRVFGALRDSEYRIAAELNTNAKNIRVRLRAKNPWACAALQVWASATASSEPVEQSGEDVVLDASGDPIAPAAPTADTLDQRIQLRYDVDEAFAAVYEKELVNAEILSPEAPAEDLIREDGFFGGAVAVVSTEPATVATTAPLDVSVPAGVVIIPDDGYLDGSAADGFTITVGSNSVSFAGSSDPLWGQYDGYPGLHYSLYEQLLRDADIPVWRRDEVVSPSRLENYFGMEPTGNLYVTGKAYDLFGTQLDLLIRRNPALAYTALSTSVPAPPPAPKEFTVNRFMLEDGERNMFSTTSYLLPDVVGVDYDTALWWTAPEQSASIRRAMLPTEFTDAANSAPYAGRLDTYSGAGSVSFTLPTAGVAVTHARFRLRYALQLDYQDTLVDDVETDEPRYGVADDTDGLALPSLDVSTVLSIGGRSATITGSASLAPTDVAGSWSDETAVTVLGEIGYDELAAEASVSVVSDASVPGIRFIDIQFIAEAHAGEEVIVETSLVSADERPAVGIYAECETLVRKAGAESSSAVPSSLAPISSTLSSTGASGTRLVSSKRRKPWASYWYTELSDTSTPGDEWSLHDSVTASFGVSTTDSGDRFIGPFTDEKLRLSLEDIPEHSDLDIAVEFFIRGDWTGNDDLATLKLTRATGLTSDVIWDATVSNTPGTTQTFPARAGTSSSLPPATEADECGSLYVRERSAVFTARLTLEHVRDDIVLDISADNVPAGASWGVSRVGVSPLAIYNVNEAFDAADNPQDLVPYESLPALVMGPDLLGSRYKSSLVFVNYAVPTELTVDEDGKVRKLRFPVYGLPEDVALFWKTAEAEFDSSPARVFDRRVDRDGYARPEHYPAELNPAAVLLSHASAGNLVIVKLATPTVDGLPISVLTAIRKKLPLHTGLLLHSEIRVSSTAPVEAAASDTVDGGGAEPLPASPSAEVIEIFDQVIDVDTDLAPDTDPYAIVGLRSDSGDINGYIGDGSFFTSRTNVTLNSTDPVDFPWWEYTGTPFVHVSRRSSNSQLVVAVWPAYDSSLEVDVAPTNVSIAGIKVPNKGSTSRSAGNIVLRADSASSLTMPQEFAITWKIPLTAIYSTEIVTGYTE